MDEIKINNEALDKQTAGNTHIDQETMIFWVFVGITVGAVLLNGYYAVFNRHYDSFILTVAAISNFTDAVIALFLGTKILAINASFYKTIGISIFFSILGFILNALGLSIIFFSIGIFIFIGMFILMMKIYDIGYIKTVLLLIIQLIIVVLINLSIQLVAGVLSLFA